MIVMKNLKTIALSISFSIIASVSVAQTSQERKISDFTSIDANEGIDVELTMAEANKCVVIADESIINYVLTEVTNNTLIIHIKGNKQLKSRKVTVKIDAKTINSIDASSGSSITSQNLIEAESLSLSSSSGADLKVTFKAPKSSCNTSSGASAKLKGVTKFFKGNASSGSNLKAKELQSINAKLDASSGADISISVEDQLEADASSGGSIKYYGSPKMVDIEKSSGGSVSKN